MRTVQYMRWSLRQIGADAVLGIVARCDRCTSIAGLYMLRAVFVANTHSSRRLRPIAASRRAAVGPARCRLLIHVERYDMAAHCGLTGAARGRPTGHVPLAGGAVAGLP